MNYKYLIFLQWTSYFCEDAQQRTSYLIDLKLHKFDKTIFSYMSNSEPNKSNYKSPFEKGHYCLHRTLYLQVDKCDKNTEASITIKINEMHYICWEMKYSSSDNIELLYYFFLYMDQVKRANSNLFKMNNDTKSNDRPDE